MDGTYFRELSSKSEGDNAWQLDAEPCQAPLQRSLQAGAQRRSIRRRRRFMQAMSAARRQCGTFFKKWAGRFGLSGPDESTAMEMLSSAVMLHLPDIAPRKSPWRVPNEAKHALRHVKTSGGYVTRVLTYLDTRSPEHDGGQTYRQAKYDVLTDEFICATTNQVLPNVGGWILLTGDVLT